MLREFFKNLEHYSNADSPLQLDEVLDHLAYNKEGLIPVITQDANTKTVLMMAWMNKHALQYTLKTHRMTYWSRSRQQLWIKGETSGHFQQLVSMAFDCDGDCILCQVNQTGAACHTGRANCFYLDVDIEKHQVKVQGLDENQIG